LPWNPDARRQQLGGTAFPTRELGGQVWVYTGERAPTEPDTDEAFVRNGMRVSGFTMPIETHWTRVMENMLDWPHLPFVHSATIGRAMSRSAATGRMDVRMEERPYGFTTSIAIDGVAQPGRLDYRFPNVMMLFIGFARRTLVLQVACVPETETRTRMVLTGARDFLRFSVLDSLFHWQNRKIALEDKRVIESSFPALIPPAGEERSVRTDAPPLAFRKVYFTRLRGSSAARDPALVAAERLVRSESTDR
jgi:Vanillate O-demethylase oxygenase C-terminal domain